MEYAVAFIIYAIVLYVAQYIVIEYAQKYLYDETTSLLGWRILAGTILFSAILTFTRTGFDRMFTDDLGATVLQAIVWFGVFTLLYQFHPPHAATISLGMLLIVPGIATIASDSLMRSPPPAQVAEDSQAEPIRPGPTRLQTSPRLYEPSEDGDDAETQDEQAVEGAEDETDPAEEPSESSEGDAA